MKETVNRPKIGEQILVHNPELQEAVLMTVVDYGPINERGNITYFSADYNGIEFTIRLRKIQMQYAGEFEWGWYAESL